MTPKGQVEEHQNPEDHVGDLPDGLSVIDSKEEQVLRILRYGLTLIEMDRFQNNISNFHTI